LIRPCWILAVPHIRVFLNARMLTSTFSVTFLCFGALGLSL
jgi:hypothetical protein